MNQVNRRDFLKKSLFVGASLTLIPKLASGFSTSSGLTLPDIAVVTGNDYFKNTITAIEQIGGISKFVPRGSKVGVLINAPAYWTKPGSYTHTEVILAVLKLINDAGAGSIVFLKEQSPDLFKRSALSGSYQSIIDSIKKDSGEYKEMEIAKAVTMKKPYVIKDLFDVDVFINIPVNKHHSGVNYTNCLKNMMGACNRDTNKTFHTKLDGNVDDVEHLAQCIADINLLRKPDLCITDATEVLKTNGPFGPGEILKPRKVFAGVNPVQMDAYGCTLLDNRPEDIRTNVLANKLGLGSYDLKSFVVKETTL